MLLKIVYVHSICIYSHEYSKAHENMKKKEKKIDFPKLSFLPTIVFENYSKILKSVPFNSQNAFCLISAS